MHNKPAGFKWLIEEKAQTFKSNDEFVAYIGAKLDHQFSDYFQVVDVFSGMYGEQHITAQLTATSDWFREFREALGGCNMSPRDLHADNWGIRQNTGDLIVIDLGF